MHDKTAARAANAVLGALLLFAPLSQAAAAPAPVNPWAAVAPALFDDEEDFLAENEFDRMSEVQLAAVPMNRRIKWTAPNTCVPAALKRTIEKVAARYGPVTVNSTVRSRAKNSSVGGKPKSFHLACRAVDFRVHGSTRGLSQFLRSQGGIGGIHRYPSGYYHIDNGPKRSW